jgi:hypothetical protein
MCDQCNYLFINGIGCHEIGCPNQGAIQCECCKETVRRREVYYANDWDGIKLCKECATRQAEYEAELEANESSEA